MTKMETDLLDWCSMKRRDGCNSEMYWLNLCQESSGMYLYIYSKNRIIILTINLSCLFQMSEPVWCVDTVNCQDGMIMWRKVGWEWGKDCHVVLHIVMNCVHSSESEITNCQSLWQFQINGWSTGLALRAGCLAVLWLNHNFLTVL